MKPLSYVYEAEQALSLHILLLKNVLCEDASLEKKKQQLISLVETAYSKRHLAGDWAEDLTSSLHALQSCGLLQQKKLLDYFLTILLTSNNKSKDIKFKQYLPCQRAQRHRAPAAGHTPRHLNKL
jgi:hypothetical protein